MTTPPPENNGLDPEAQFKAFLRDFYTSEIFPMFEKSQKDALEGQSREIRSWVVSNTKPEEIAKQILPILSEQLQKDVQPLNDGVKALMQRVGALESAPTRSPTPSPLLGAGAGGEAPTLPPVNTAAVTPAAGGLGEGPSKAMAVIETILDIIIEKGLPAWNTIQQSRQMAKLGSMDAATIQEFRAKNPFAAVMLGQQLAPDNNVMGMMAQFPYIGANAFAAGIRARHLGPLLAEGAGGNIWPGTPGAGLPGSLPGLIGAPLPTSTPPTGRASMQSPRSYVRRPASKGLTNGESRQVKKQLKRLSELVR